MDIRDIVPGKKYKFANGAVVIAEGFKRHLNHGEGVVFVRPCDGPAWIAKASELYEYDEVEEKAKELYSVWCGNADPCDRYTWDELVEFCRGALIDDWRRVARHVLGVK